MASPHLPLLRSLAWFLLTLPLVCGAAQKPIDDVRVLIDISGSMKRTDPNNLRKPALRLFVSLLPDGSQAGVWTFGQWVNMLVKDERVDARWKENARKSANEISSLGLFTNIEDALRRSTWDWKRPDPAYRRSLILLTDGLVDIAKNPEQNASSRQRILDELLPQLQQANVTIHSIALSQESDRDLLRQLSAATSGWFETIETSEELERLFLRMFEKVATTNKLPLIDNRVTVDDSIREATFLVFRKEGSKETRITSPDGKTIDHTSAPNYVQWHSEDRYDLITIKKPASGEWEINAALDPDNRVMVVTDLQLNATNLASNLEALRPITLTAELTQKGEIITQQKFLSFVKILLTQASMDGQQTRYEFKDDGKSADKKAKDGIYTLTMDQSLLPGEHEIEIIADGTTFKRTSRQLARVHKDPVNASITKDADDAFTITVTPFRELINSEKMIITAQHITPNGDTKEFEIPRTGTNEWHSAVAVEKTNGQHKIILNVSGTRHDGSIIEKTMDPLFFSVGDVGNTVIEQAEPEPIAEPQAETMTAPEEKALTQKPDDIPGEEVEINWLMTSLRILVFNIFLAGFIFAGYKVRPLVRKKLIPNPSEALANDN